jgi:uncharacterized protein (DUF1810 family)
MRLERFTEAQGPVFAAVLAELAAGRKASHWMWFIFPQLRGLGSSERADFYGIADLAEARGYLAHLVLGPRLMQCLALLMAADPGLSAHAILGSPDDMKLRSCLTLFAEAALDPGDRGRFQAGLQRFYGGAADPRTIALLRPGA